MFFYDYLYFLNETHFLIYERDYYFGLGFNLNNQRAERFFIPKNLSAKKLIIDFIK